MRKINRRIDQLIDRFRINPAQTRHRATPPHSTDSSTALLSPSFSIHPESPLAILTNSGSEGSLINYAHPGIGNEFTNRRRCLVDMLPDDIMLLIFDFFPEEWQTLVHVCRRWRNVVFESPRRLKLQLVCTHRTPVRDMLDIWPALPLIIHGYDGYSIKYVDNIVAALEQSNRVCRIDLRDISSWNLEDFSAAMQQPFPELMHIQLWLNNKSVKTVPVLPDSFLGESAPNLRELNFCDISFPGLPILLLSATHLVHLTLYDIPHNGYFPPDEMVTAFPTLTSLETFRLQFRSPRSCPDRANRLPPPATRIVLPALKHFWFKGVCEYLEDLVARIDAPRLGNLEITFFNQIIFDTTQFVQFISRTPMLRALEKASVSFEDGTASIEISPRTSYRGLNVRIPCKELDWQVSSLEQVSTSCLPPLSMLEDLYISQRGWQQHWQDNIENTLWLELLHPFAAVKNLYLSEKFAQRIGPALQELVGGRTTEVLPTLQNIFVEGLRSSVPIQEGIGQFVATRQAIGRPIAVIQWNRRDF